MRTMMDACDESLPERKSRGTDGHRSKPPIKIRESVTIMLLTEIKDLIEGESRRTGETVTSIVERAVLNLFRSYSFR